MKGPSNNHSAQYRKNYDAIFRKRKRVLKNIPFGKILYMAAGMREELLNYTCRMSTTPAMFELNGEQKKGII